MARKPRTRRRERKSVPIGRAYIQSTFNNTIVTLTDPSGNVIGWGSGGHRRLQGLSQVNGIRRSKGGRGCGLERAKSTGFAR